MCMHQNCVTVVINFSFLSCTQKCIRKVLLIDVYINLFESVVISFHLLYYLKCVCLLAFVACLFLRMRVQARSYYFYVRLCFDSVYLCKLFSDLDACYYCVCAQLRLTAACLIKTTYLLTYLILNSHALNSGGIQVSTNDPINPSIPSSITLKSCVCQQSKKKIRQLIVGVENCCTD